MKAKKITANPIDDGGYIAKIKFDNGQVAYAYFSSKEMMYKAVARDFSELVEEK